MAGFQAVDGRVAEQQGIAVVVVGRRRAGIAVLLDRRIADVVGEIPHQAGGQNAQVARRGAVAGLGQTFRIFVGG